MRKIDGGSTARKSPIGSGQQDVGHSGVATGRGVFHFRSSSSVGKKKTQLMEFHFISSQRKEWNGRLIVLIRPFLSSKYIRNDKITEKCVIDLIYTGGKHLIHEDVKLLKFNNIVIFILIRQV